MSPSNHDETVRRSFARQVRLFTGEDALFARRPAGALTWVEPLDRGMIALDVACGAAHAAEQIAPHVRQVIGLDLTPALLRLAAERLARAGIANVLLQEGNAAELPFRNESFDLVVCRGALHHFPDPARSVREMARVCRAGGRVVVSDVIAVSAAVRPRYDEIHRLLDPSHAGVLLEEELADLLRSTVGDLVYGETSDPFRLPVEHIFTEVADRDAVLRALREELDGGTPTGFQPVLDGDRLLVSFSNTVVHARRPPAAASA